MKALIIDDERLARREVRRLLSEFSWISVIGEAENADEALTKINELRPDLLFLDVQMPGKTGFDLLESIRGEPPHVIFTTAYDEFALRAFEVNALDYLVKPITPERLALALSRVREGGPQPVSDAPLRVSDHVLVRDGARCFDSAKPLIYRSLSTLEQRLPMDAFFRINRQQIVNLDYIENIESWFSGGLKIWLRGGEECEVSRRAARTFRQKLSL